MAETLRLAGPAGLSHGLLAWVLAGHAAAVWLAKASLESTPDTPPPQVLRVRWIEAQPVTADPRPVVPRPAPSRPRLQPPAPAMPPVAEPPVAEPPAAGPEHVAPAVAAPPAAAAPAPSPAPAVVAEPAPPVMQPPSYHADYLANPAPVYPALSRRLREEGTVRLRVLVGPDGLAREVRLDAGSDHPRLDEAARAAVAGWRFLPARLGTQAVSGWVLVPIAFSLRR